MAQARRLKDTKHEVRYVSARLMAFGYGETAIPVVDFRDTDGRRHLVKLDTQMATLIANQLRDAVATAERLAAAKAANKES